MDLFAHAENGTALNPDEQLDLIPNLSTREELNEFERLNILEANEWAFASRQLRNPDFPSEAHLRDLHRRMFRHTWKWAGKYRSSEKNLGIPHHCIRDAIATLLGDLRYWLDHATYPPDEIAIRLHHQLVQIHPFSNGNGRHTRLLADILAVRLKRPPFTWGSTAILSPTDIRHRYITALQAADHHNLAPLRDFARS